MNLLTLDALPMLPQLQPLLRIAPALWQHPAVIALWIGGSIARGQADRYSDVDLHIAVRAETLETWKQPDVTRFFGGTCVGYKFLTFGEDTFLHHLLLNTGDIYDIVVQSAAAPVPEETVLVLGCRDEALLERLRMSRPVPAIPFPPANPAVIREILTDFWINTHKHRKVLARRLHLLAMTGIQTESALLLRLWYVEATGTDCGAQRTQTIHGLTDLMRTVEQAKGAEALVILGASMASREDIIHAIEALRDAVSHAGHALADRFCFEYPETLEQITRTGWADFLHSEN